MRHSFTTSIFTTVVKNQLLENDGKFGNFGKNWSSDSTESRKRKFIDSVNSQAMKLRSLRLPKQPSRRVSEIAVADLKKYHRKIMEKIQLIPKNSSSIDQQNKTNLKIIESQEILDLKSTESEPKFKINENDRLPETNSAKNAKAQRNFIKKSEMFHRHILKVAYNCKRKAKLDKRRILLSERETNLNLFHQVTVLRYRENVFRAASKLSRNLPPFPNWAYKNKSEENLHIIQINVGGTIFEVFDETLMNLSNTKLSNSYLFQCKDSTMFFDRDSLCFNAILNFYRTGRLHAPANSCLSFFEEELMFWGLNEDFMEPCCVSDYQANRRISHILDNYMEDNKLPINEFDKKSFINKSQLTCKWISLSEIKNLFSRWYTFIYGLAILGTMITMVFSTNALGRVDKTTKHVSDPKPNESIVRFFSRTECSPMIYIIDRFLDGFFFLDFLTRFILFPDKLNFWANFLNWCDLSVIISSSITDLPMLNELGYETYLIVLKIPRLFRIFHLTKPLRVGMDAFILTLRKSTSELLLVGIITIVAICFFGVTIYVVELINETPDRNSDFKSIFDGMWWAIGTLATVGYGDFVPRSAYGFFVGYFCILTGIIITQLPVPIFLKNFSTFYNQIEARMKLVNAIINNNIDPEAIKFTQTNFGSQKITAIKLSRQSTSEMISN